MHPFEAGRSRKDPETRDRDRSISWKSLQQAWQLKISVCRNLAGRFRVRGQHFMPTILNHGGVHCKCDAKDEDKPPRYHASRNRALPKNRQRELQRKSAIVLAHIIFIGRIPLPADYRRRTHRDFNSKCCRTNAALPSHFYRQRILAGRAQLRR